MHNGPIVYLVYVLFQHGNGLKPLCLNAQVLMALSTHAQFYKYETRGRILGRNWDKMS